MNAFPEARSYSISPTKLLPRMMKLAGVDQSHYQPIIKLCQLLEKFFKTHLSSISGWGSHLFLFMCESTVYEAARFDKEEFR